MIEICSNMIGGQCITWWHMLLFILGMMLIGFIIGFVAGREVKKK